MTKSATKSADNMKKPADVGMGIKTPRRLLYDEQLTLKARTHISTFAGSVLESALESANSSHEPI